MKLHTTHLRPLIVLLASLALSSALMRGQELATPIEDFWDDRACEVVAPEGYLNDFWSSCLTLYPSAPTHIVHLGDSHVQGGFFTEPIRQTFQHLVGSGSIGWIGPYRLLRTNQPLHATLTSPTRAWRGGRIIQRSYHEEENPTGIFVQSTSKGNQVVKLQSKNGTPFDRILLLRPSSAPECTLREPELKARPTLTFQPSSGVAVDTFLLPRPTYQAELQVPPRGVLYGIILQNGKLGTVVHTLGHNGAFFQTYRDSGFLDAFAKVFRPRLIILSMGTNESLVRSFSPSSVASEVEGLVRDLQRRLPHCAFILTTPIYAYKRSRKVSIPNPNAEEVAHVIRQAAKRLGVGYIDLYTVFGGSKEVEQLVALGILSQDRIHLTHEGYAATGWAVGHALRKDLTRYTQEGHTPGIFFSPTPAGGN